MNSTTGTDFVIAKELLEEIDDDEEEVGYACLVAGAGAMIVKLKIFRLRNYR